MVLNEILSVKIDGETLFIKLVEVSQSPLRIFLLDQKPPEHKIHSDNSFSFKGSQDWDLEAVIEYDLIRDNEIRDSISNSI